MTRLADHQCKPAVARLSGDEVAALLAELRDWRIENGLLTRTFAFANYHETMAFVNAVAWIAHRQDHHPDLAVGYNGCRVDWSTHSVGGLSENDFICAARVDALLTA